LRIKSEAYASRRLLVVVGVFAYTNCKRVIDVALRRPETMKSAARNVPQPFQVAGKSKRTHFDFPATWKGCGTFSEEIL
jgi:hypothetical protein